jgi:hypothetical protein
MTHEELHNNIPVRTEHSEDAVFILSLLSDRINSCIDGNTHIIVAMLSTVIKHNPVLKDVMLAAIELAGLEDNNSSPELN